MDTWEETTGQGKPEAWNGSEETSSQPSALEMEIADLKAKLAPPSLEQATGELLRCLRLTAPVGMTDADRREWLLVAFDEIKEIPMVEFVERCAHARKIADHPAKIVPAIFSLKYGEYHGANALRERLRSREAQHASRFMKRLTEAAATPERPFDTAKIREEMGFPAGEPVSRRAGLARVPTEQELAELSAQFNQEHYGRKG